MMAIGHRQHLVALDTPNGSSGYLPLDPATWYCQMSTQEIGQALLTGAFHPGITTASRVQFGGRVFHVVSVVNRDERDLETVLVCTEVFE